MQTIRHARRWYFPQALRLTPAGPVNQDEEAFKGPRRAQRELSQNSHGVLRLTGGISQATSEIDAILEQRYRNLEFQMFADGCTDFDAIAEVVALQREADAAWRAETLDSLRAWLAAEVWSKV